MEDECFPAISMNTACTRLPTEIMVKDEPFSETESLHSSCPPSPQSSNLTNSDTYVDTLFVEAPIVSTSIICFKSITVWSLWMARLASNEN